MPTNSRTAKIQIILIVVSILLTNFTTLSAQHDHHDASAHHKEHQNHTEIATGGGIAVSNEFTGIAPAFHVHFVRGLTPHLGVGAGYEAIFGPEYHQSLGLMLNIRPIHLLDINIGPGLVLPVHDEGFAFSFQIESALTWNVIGKIHAGPVLDLGLSAHGWHLITGVHIGLDLN